MADEVTRIPVKTLTKMMVAGQNQVVMKYLRTLPSDECAEVREQLIKNLEMIQQQQKKKPESTATSPTSERKESSSASSSSGTSGKTSSSSSKPSSSSGGTAGRHTKKPSSSSKDSVGPKSGLQVTTAKDSESDSSASEKSDKPQVGNYVYQKDLGKGQFGVVFKAKHSISGLKVAIKEIDTEQVGSAALPGIMKEAEVMADLDHPNCLKIIEVMKKKNRIYFVLDYINRGSLLGLIKSQGNFTDEVAAYCTRHTCEGLKYLHGKCIIHRDIKCANLLLTSDGIIKLADFGTAKEDAGKNFTVIGTPFWMAPEIIEVSGASTVSDIWSLGCTIVEMLRGTPPYFELVTMQALFKIVEDAHPPIPATFTEETRNFLLKTCFVKDIKKRSPAEMLLKHPWVSRGDGATYTYDQLCAMIKGKEAPKETASGSQIKITPTPKGKSSSSSKYPSSSKSSSASPSNSLANSADNTEASLATIAKLQLEIEQLSKEQLKLQREYDQYYA